MIVDQCVCGHRAPSHDMWGRGRCEANDCPCAGFAPAPRENDEPCMCGTPFTCLADEHPGFGGDVPF